MTTKPYFQAYQMAKEGYGWEDVIAKLPALTEREARQIVFVKKHLARFESRPAAPVNKLGDRRREAKAEPQ